MTAERVGLASVLITISMLATPFLVRLGDRLQPLRGTVRCRDTSHRRRYCIPEWCVLPACVAATLFTVAPGSAAMLEMEGGLDALTSQHERLT